MDCNLTTSYAVLYKFCCVFVVPALRVLPRLYPSCQET